MSTIRSYAYNLKDVMCGNFEYAWDQEQLWEISKHKKVFKVDLRNVKHWIYYPCWSENDCFLSIFQVLIQKDKFPEHIERINNADTKYPIIVMEDKYDRFGTILDGNHRFAKLITQNNVKKIEVVYFTRKELDKLKIKM